MRPADFATCKFRIKCPIILSGNLNEPLNLRVDERTCVYDGTIYPA